MQFTVDEALAMLRCGVLADDNSAELLNGFIVHTDRSSVGADPTMHSPAHRSVVRKLTKLAAKVDSPHRNVQIQLPIVCGPRQMPELDFAVVLGPDSNYAQRLPTAADASCVIEVADSSLERDREEKLPI